MSERFFFILVQGMFKHSVYAHVLVLKKIIIIIESLPDLLELARCTSNIEIDANVCVSVTAG